MSNLVPCEGCSRHVRQGEARCPFCNRARSGNWIAALFACTSLLSVACSGATRTPASAPAPAATAAPAPALSPAPVASAEPPSRPPTDVRPEAVAAYGAPPPPRDAVTAPMYGAPPRPAPAPEPESASPNDKVDIAPATVAGGEIGNANEVVQNMRIGFARCYEKGLATNPDAQGQVTLTIRVGVAGQILGVNTQHTAKVPPGVVSCITGRAASSEFSPPTKTKPKHDVTVTTVLTLKKP